MDIRIREVTVDSAQDKVLKVSTSILSCVNFVMSFVMYQLCDNFCVCCFLGIPGLCYFIRDYSPGSGCTCAVRSNSKG